MEKEFIFEEGKYYKHTTGILLHIIGRLNTTLFGNDTLIAESLDKENHDQFITVGETKDNTTGYKEITKEEWDSHFDEIKEI